MEQWKESFVIVNIGKEGGTVLYFSCSYDWLFLSPFFLRVKKLLWFKGFLFTQDMILRSPQALCIHALFGESLSKSHFMVMAYDCVNGKLWNRSLWLFPMNTWISYRAKQGGRSPLLGFFSHDFFLIFKKLQSKNICRNHPQLKLTSWRSQEANFPPILKTDWNSNSVLTLPNNIYRHTWYCLNSVNQFETVFILFINSVNSKNSVNSVNGENSEHRVNAV